ncbi:MAG: hypothetical protein COV67_01745 [Nitrospinae bacterium CG11_big_fil_rev_8_21_14_0_20_56_8]|nr:MAG: hypothetical protein COV67_01745 [Nitrospinae bacterium CG11_big_fil_rev_8_21_14_0_20_56_8]
MAARFGQICGLTVAGIMAFVYGFLFHQERVMTALRWVTQRLSTNWRAKIETFLEEFAKGFAVARNPAALSQVFLYSILEWALTIVSFYPLYLAYGLNTFSLQSMLILTVMVMVFVTVLPTPGFIGSFNLGVYVALHVIMKEPEAVAANFGLMAWLLNFLVILGSGLYFIFHEHLSVKKLVAVEEEGKEMNL